MKIKSKLLLATASVAGIAVSFATSVAAQSRPAGDDSTNDTVTGNEIVVTAQFRAQSVQDTPLAISAISGDTLAQKGATDITGAANLAPNVQLSGNAGNFGGMAAIFIRGVGQSDPHFAVEPGVGMYVDDVYFGVLTGSVFDLLDVDRVEVLRGPQGTLAGKNSIGGSVKLYSTRPGPDTNGYMEVGYGSRNSLYGRAAGNLTLIDGKLYARVAAGAQYSDGYMTRLDYACATGNFANGTQRTDVSCKIGEQGGKRVFTARGTLLFTPSDGVKDTLIVDVTRDRSQNPAAKTTVQSALWAGTANYITGAHSYTNYEDYISRPTGGSAAGHAFVMPDTTPLDAWGVTNLLNIELSDNLKLDSITAYRASNVTFSATQDAAPASIVDQIWKLDHKQFTQELRLSGDLGEFVDWTLGGYYYHASGTSGGRVNIPGGLAVGGGGLNLDILFRDPVKTESKSAFLHTVFHPLAGLNLTAAVRYTDDRKDFTFNRYDPNGSPHPLLGALLDFPVSYKGDRVDYRLGLDYAWSDGFMTYAQVSTGYKGGGVNPRPFFTTQALPYAPEKLTAYEVGFKSQLFDRRFTLNMSAFLNDYTDLQAQLKRCDSISPFPGAPCNQSTNVGDARIKGVELEASLRPVNGLSIDASVGYLDFKYKRINAATNITLDMTNVYTPKWTAAGGIQYTADLGGTGSLTPRFDVSYRSRVEGDAVNVAASSLTPRTLLNASLLWSNDSEDWEAKLAVTNLTDKFYYQSAYAQPSAPYFAAVGIVGEPRRVMFSIKRRFQ
ncbi:iron complex outermembrane recepter protein [Novosphingobium sp. CF614]|uniref:TonB-dependent receptor n=1 Tax=Novosphingobium sp. CF614 TaxID=1884364 RepID=UPI0008E83060|nr:TonB-dependent receptor [Novosphingobium sp. CF614]SFG30261.1 iron complex outermembrane recepter protein [Novosphingobium sp. CF614]